ncbi:hypothetical protein Ade02nite_10300 [Paractinoplanes deccanensis]|uniref:SWIM-type domain-containing protein n=1 Tax=Paractinoplanes deccanensis TaxID=113561 RepID=A0ABQ3XXE4_9ACTN|nr:hypothetical protein [Actinoplanes deccanensis]GID72389.1 hypothetical protein Ade02nite_10300 [Actinoplanes deccanensis]
MRADLRALTPATLAELTNRGLVKRATRELEREAPKLSEDADGTVHAVFPDGTATDLPPGGLDAGTCSCGAAGVCRHVLGLVLAYQTWEADGEPATAGTPETDGDAASNGTGVPDDSGGQAGPGTETPAATTDAGAGPGGTRPGAGPGGAQPGAGPGGAQPDAVPSGAKPGGVKAGAGPSGVKAGAGGAKLGVAKAGADGAKLGVAKAGADGARPGVAKAGADGARPGGAKAGAGGAGPDGGYAGWSPGEFTDEELVARVGARMMASARRSLRAGYVARVHRGRPADPVPTVELPTATVRFLVPRDLGFARSDAVVGSRDDVLALAVWAFREADERAPGEADVQVQVGGGPTGGGAGLGRAVAFAGTVVREGAVHLGAGLDAEVAGVRAELEAARMRWPLLALDDLVGQLGAYRERSARYRPEALADHVAELFARHRSVTRGGASLASRVLGTDEASETPLRRARLDGLGARVTAAGDERTVEVFLAHADSSTVLVLRRQYTTDDVGPELGRRRVAGVTVGALASGAVITESASRSASRAVRLGTRRLSRTEAMTTRDAWRHLPPTLLVPGLAALAAELDALPPRPVRARIEAELVRVVPIAEVRSVTYAPGAQRVDAVIADADGTTATVSAVHAACAPGRLDAVVAALGADVRFVAGSVRRSGGSVVIDPIGFASDGGVVVPDLAAAGTAPGPRHRPAPVVDPLGQAVTEALGLLAEVAHRGLLHLPSPMSGRLRDAAKRLDAARLRRAGAALTGLAARLGPDPGDEAVEAWADAYLRVSLCAELMPESP